jgi:hypothetical protein
MKFLIKYFKDVRNRRSESLKRLFDDFFIAVYTIRTDGYHSYPNAVNSFLANIKLLTIILCFQKNLGQNTNKIKTW